MLALMTPKPWSIELDPFLGSWSWAIASSERNGFSLIDCIILKPLRSPVGGSIGEVMVPGLSPVGHHRSSGR